jgi:hypothetical protein
LRESGTKHCKLTAKMEPKIMSNLVYKPLAPQYVLLSISINNTCISTNDISVSD